ncbi:hypothetical protein ACFFX0_29075 [Citricoccus parietis]|uniref:Uncharacterized protein n=1 Tax=Citricoccus parietis TaxID=592307 RepID=A0ABV5G7W0_9MICC
MASRMMAAPKNVAATAFSPSGPSRPQGSIPSSMVSSECEFSRTVRAAPRRYVSDVNGRHASRSVLMLGQAKCPTQLISRAVLRDEAPSGRTST